MRHDIRPLFRLFYAIKPPVRIARQIDHLTETLAGDVRRVRPEHHHMTLGITVDHDDYPHAVVKALLRAGTTVAADPFDLRLDRLSMSNRSVALCPSKAVPPLKRLQAELSTAIKRAGVRARPGWSFSPHQTLFYRDGRPDQQPIYGFTWRVEEFVLVCSHVGRTRHDILGTWSLKGSGQYRLF